MNRINSIYPTNANFIVTLKNHENAKSVWVTSLPFNSDIYPIKNLAFLKKQNGRWQSKFKLEKGIYNYSFIVDGKEVLDKETAVKEVVNLIGSKEKCHQKCIEFSNESHELIVNVNVPNKEDMVYIVGNQESIFKVPLIMLRKTSEYDRQLKVNVHFPATFKFVTAVSEKQGVIKGFEDKKFIEVKSLQETNNYEIIGWKEN